MLRKLASAVFGISTKKSNLTMKRYLYIVRHAKAEDSSSFFNDFNRELTPAGTMDAARMGKFLAEQGLKPDQLVSSSAARAFQTSRIMAEQLGVGEEQIQTTRDLYDGGPKAYLSAVNNAPAHAENVMIFGHNPDVSFFAEYLTHASLDSMSKGSVVVVEFENMEWATVSAKTGKFLNYYSPKEFR